MADYTQDMCLADYCQFLHQEFFAQPFFEIKQVMLLYRQVIFFLPAQKIYHFPVGIQ
jgi:hypothetical protein